MPLVQQIFIECLLYVQYWREWDESYKTPYSPEVHSLEDVKMVTPANKDRP